MDIKEIKENKIKTIFKFAIPSTIAMLLQTAITLTDGYFTGNYVGENALAAINLGLPILYFYLGLGLSIGVGGSVICGRLLGAKDTIYKFAQRIGATLTVMKGGEHWFHTNEQMKFLDNWIRSSIK